MFYFPCVSGGEKVLTRFCVCWKGCTPTLSSSTSYSTSEKIASSKTVFVVDFTVKCSSGSGQVSIGCALHFTVCLGVFDRCNYLFVRWLFDSPGVLLFAVHTWSGAFLVRCRWWQVCPSSSFSRWHPLSGTDHAICESSPWFLCRQILCYF